MKKTLAIMTILIISLFITSYLFAQEEGVIGKYEGGVHVYYSEGKEIAKEIRNGETYDIVGNIPDGLVRTYEPFGDFFEGNYKNNKLEGLAKGYYESGKLQWEGNYKNDKLEGLAKKYYEGGKLQEEGNYKNDKLEGVSKKYYEGGKLQEEGNYKDGELYGTKKAYGENGNLLWESNYENGRFQWRNIYNEYGKLKKKFNVFYYSSGRIRSIAIWENPKGTLPKGSLPDGFFFNAIPPDGYGSVYDYDDKGEFRNASVSIESGSFDKVVTFHAGKRETNYKNGELDGVVKVYTDTGILQLEENYKNGKQNGIQKSYTENGMLEEESNWKDGKHEGITKIYWENNDIIAYIDTYKNGERINRKSYNVYGKLLWEQDYPYTLGTDKEENKQEINKK